jgi:hypothetical protein
LNARVATSGYSSSEKGWAATDIPQAGVPGTCFLAFAFNAKGIDKAVRDGFKRAIEEPPCGLTLINLKTMEHNDNINDRMMAELRRAEVIVADFTGNRPNVYFEAGLGKAWGKEVVFTCSNTSFKSVGLHFDTSPFKHIVWNDAEDLREKLACRLVNTVPSLTRNFAAGRISP